MGASRSPSRLAAVLAATCAVLLLAWASIPTTGFSTGLSPRARPLNLQFLPGTPVPSAAGEASASAVAIFAAGALAGSLAAASSRQRLQRTGRAADKEDWSLKYLSKKHESEVKEVRRLCGDILPSDYDDVKLLRYAMQHDGNPSAAAENVREVLQWRNGKGAKIVAAAKEAIAKATSAGGWDNKPVNEAAPHSAKISKHITSAQMVVVSTKVGDLATCIRASTIDSEALMKSVTEEEMMEFFIYAREINSTIADRRTRATGFVVRLIAANDLTGVSKFPDQKFQNALTGSAKKAVTLYPGFSGPTILLNLPWIARMLVSLLTPLFPGAVREKLKFAKSSMDYMKNLEDVVKEPLRSQFVDDLQAVMSS